MSCMMNRQPGFLNSKLTRLLLTPIPEKQRTQLTHPTPDPICPETDKHKLQASPNTATFKAPERALAVDSFCINGKRNNGRLYFASIVKETIFKPRDHCLFPLQLSLSSLLQGDVSIGVI